MALSSLAMAVGDARAVPLTVRLDYAAGPGCPDAAGFAAVVAARLGYDPFIEKAPQEVVVRIEPGATTIDGRIEWRDASGKWAGEQTFPSVSTDCPHLARTMGFALAVQIQLLATAAAPDTDAAAPAPPASPAAGQSPAPPSPSVTSATAVGSPPATEHRPTFAIGAGPAVGFGMSSGPVALGRLFAVAAWTHVSLELAAITSLPATSRREDGAGFSQQLFLASAAACATSTRWNACLVANAGVAQMAGEDVDLPTSASAPVVEAGARVRLIQHLGAHVFLSEHADGLVNVTRSRGTLDHVPVWTAPRFAGVLGLEAGLHFR